MRLDAPSAFITAKSLRRSRTELVNVATMQSMINTTTTTEDASTTERVLPTTAVWACVIWRTGLYVDAGQGRAELRDRSLNFLRPAFHANQDRGGLNASERSEFRLSPDKCGCHRQSPK